MTFFFSSRSLEASANSRGRLNVNVLSCVGLDECGRGAFFWGETRKKWGSRRIGKDESWMAYPSSIGFVYLVDLFILLIGLGYNSFSLIDWVLMWQLIHPSLNAAQNSWLASGTNSNCLVNRGWGKRKFSFIGDNSVIFTQVGLFYFVTIVNCNA